MRGFKVDAEAVVKPLTARPFHTSKVNVSSASRHDGAEDITEP